MGPATASPVAGPVNIEKADYVIVSTGLNGKNPGEVGYYDKPSTYVGADGDPKMPSEIGMGVYDLVAAAARFGVYVHVSAAQSAAGYRYDRSCATEWQYAAEKMCYDLGDDGTLGGSFVIDTCAESREKILTRRDLGQKDAWHFILEKDTCETVLFHELDKLKYLSCMFIDDAQQDGWISLLRRGCGADSWPESLSKITPPGIPFCKVFLEGHTIGIDAHTAPDSATAEEEQHDDDVPSELFVAGRADTYECVDADKNGVQSWRKCNIISISPKEAVVDILQPKRAPPPRPGALRVEPSSPTELPVPTEVTETPPTSLVEEENLADDQRLGGPPTEELTWHYRVNVDPKRLRVVPSAATGGPVGSPQAAGPSSSSGRSPAPPSGSARASIFVPEDLGGSRPPAAASSRDIDQPKDSNPKGNAKSFAKPVFNGTFLLSDIASVQVQTAPTRSRVCYRPIAASIAEKPMERNTARNAGKLGTFQTTLEEIGSLTACQRHSH